MHLIGKNRSFALLFFGSLVSEIGNTFYAFAIGLYVATVTGNATAMATFVSVGIIVRVAASPIAGKYVDKLNRVKIIYITDYIRGILFLVAGFLMFVVESSATTIWMLYGVTVIASLNAAMFGPAVAAAVPEIVGLKNLQAANSAQSIVGSFQSIVGILLGAVVYSFLGLGWILILNGITFFFSAVSEMFIKTPYKEEASHLGDDETEKASFSDAIAHIKSIKGFGSLLVSILFINFAVSPLFSVGIVYLFNNILVKPAMDLAITNVVFSASTLIAGIVIGAIKLKSSGATIRRFIALLTLGFILISINIALVMNGIISYPVFFMLTLVLNLFMGVTIIFVNVPLNTGMTKVIAPSYRGRVFSLTGALAQIAMPVSLILSGFVIDNFGIVSLAGVCSFLAIIPTVVFIMNRNLRHLFEGIDHANAKEHLEPLATETA